MVGIGSSLATRRIGTPTRSRSPGAQDRSRAFSASTAARTGRCGNGREGTIEPTHENVNVNVVNRVKSGRRRAPDRVAQRSSKLLVSRHERISTVQTWFQPVNKTSRKVMENRRGASSAHIVSCHCYSKPTSDAIYFRGVRSRRQVKGKRPLLHILPSPHLHRHPSQFLVFC